MPILEKTLLLSLCQPFTSLNSSTPICFSGLSHVCCHLCWISFSQSFLADVFLKWLAHVAQLFCCPWTLFNLWCYCLVMLPKVDVVLKSFWVVFCRKLPLLVPWRWGPRPWPPLRSCHISRDGWVDTLMIQTYTAPVMNVVSVVDNWYPLLT